jgi:hypothetical protein
MDLYDDAEGNTSLSLAFYRDHRHQLGPMRRAALTFPGATPGAYTCILTDIHGTRMHLSGVTCGYVGDGPRAAVEILLECDFTLADAARAFTDYTLTVDLGPATVVNGPPTSTTGASGGVRTSA